MRLGDMNDHSPVFDKEEYHVNIPESALINTPITKLKVSQVTKVSSISVCLATTHACVRDSNLTPEFTMNPLYI